VPTKYLLEAQECMSIGVPDEDIAAILGVPISTLRIWLKTPKPGAPDPYKGFRLNSRRKEAREIACLVRTITPKREKAPETGREFNLPIDKTSSENARWLLARRRPDQFGRSSDLSKDEREAQAGSGIGPELVEAALLALTGVPGMTAVPEEVQKEIIESVR